jgi:hypothetical protein
MVRPVAIIAGLAAMATMAGCADLMQQSAISQLAPEWFEEKAGEVKGEGYPELADIPEVRPFEGNLKQWQTQASELKASADQLEARKATEAPYPTPEEIRATAAQWRALAEGTAQPPAGPESSDQ